ncbi:MAG: tetratricopeptide repeat protein [Planctomycetota bacterium]
MHGEMAEILHEVQKTLCVYLDNLLSAIYSDWWQECVINRGIRIRKEITSIKEADLHLLLKISDSNWRDISQKGNLSHKDRNYFKEMETIRNKWAHSQTNRVPMNEYCRDLDTILCFLGSLKADEKIIKEVKKEYERAVLELEFVKRRLNEINKNKECKEIYINTTTKKKLITAEDYYRKGLGALYCIRRNLSFSAIRYFTLAIKKNPMFAKAYSCRGEAHLFNENRKEAMADFNKAIEINPNLAEAYFGRAQVREQQKKALMDIYLKRNRKKGIKEPLHINRKYRIGEELIGRKAIDNYSKAIEINPAYKEAYEQRAFLREFSCYDLNGVIRDYSKLIEMCPKESAYYSSRAIAWEEHSDYIAAINDYSEAIKLELDEYPDIDCRLWRGKLLLILGDIDKAIEDFSKVIQISELEEAFNCRGKAYFDKGEYDSAIADFTIVIELHGEYYADSFNCRGLAKKAKGDLLDAEKDIQKAVELAPNEKHFKFNLDEVRRQIIDTTGTKE